MRVLGHLLAGVLLSAAAAPASAAEELVVDLSRSVVAITAGFVGSELLLFGATDGKGDVVVVGTSLFQIIFVTANVTILQAINNQTVDVVLALLLLTGGVIGAQMGARASGRLQGEHLRGLLGLMVIAVCAKLTYDLVITPLDLFFVGGVVANCCAWPNLC